MSPPQSDPPPLTAFTENARDLKFAINVHPDGSFWAIKAIFEFPPLSGVIVEKNP